MMTGGFLLSFYTKRFDGTFCRRLLFSLRFYDQNSSHSFPHKMNQMNVS